MLEAFADGTLVVVSDIPELAELVEDRTTGFRCIAESASSLAAVLAGIAAMPLSARRAVSERARGRYLSQFTLAAMVDAYAAVYRADGVAQGGRRETAPAA